MKTRFLLFVTILFSIISTTAAFAQREKATDANIHGHVIDARTRAHIPFVTISLKDTTIGTVADASGHFFLKNLPIGEYTIIAEAIGMELHGGVKNIFDEFQDDIDAGPFRDSVYTYGPMTPRTYFIGVKFTM